MLSVSARAAGVNQTLAAPYSAALTVVSASSQSLFQVAVVVLPRLQKGLARSSENVAPRAVSQKV
jgi:hypothetical protein